MSNYKRYRIEADNLDIRMKTINNFFSAYSLASDSQLLIGQMLETIRCQEEALKWYRFGTEINNRVILPPNWFTDTQDPEATKRLIEISEELRNKREKI